MINSCQLILGKKTEAINAYLISHNKGEGGERETDRQTDRQTDRDTETERDLENYRDTERQADI